MASDKDGKQSKPGLRKADAEFPEAAPPARAAAYIPPMAVPKESRYHTIDMKAVRLSPDIDPQRMKTQLSLRAIRATAVPRPSRLRVWLSLLLAGGTLGAGAWWFSRWRAESSARELAESYAAQPQPPDFGSPARSVVTRAIATRDSADSVPADSIQSQGQGVEPPPASEMTTTAAASGAASIIAPVSPVPPSIRHRGGPSPNGTPKSRIPTSSAEGEASSSSNQPKLWLE